MGEHRDLLRRYMPQLKYDSHEQFFADRVDEVLACGHAELRRRREGRLDQVLARGAEVEPPAEEHPDRSGDPAAAELTLDLLGAEYEAGLGPAQDGDYLAVVGQDYRALSQRMHQETHLRNVIYGRARRDREGRLWLQYWLYYFYNDYSMAGGFGLHEGDWELVQLRMKDDGVPEVAVYAQHKHAEQRRWGDVERVEPDRVQPIVYVGCGSHASYFAPGMHKAGPVWWDVSDGERGTPPDTELVELDDDRLPRWIGWPGVWGGTRARLRDIEQPSPPGPRGTIAEPRKHWDDPSAIDVAEHEVEHYELTGEPPIVIRRRGRRVLVSYDVRELRKTDFSPERLTVVVNMKQGGDETTRAPPRTYTYAIEHTLEGDLDIDARLDGERGYDVRARLMAVDGRATNDRCEMLRRPLWPDNPGIRAWNAFARGIRAGWARTGGPVADVILRRRRGR
ncbi:MAG TPA: hypothetical protein VF712_13185 [Thermoleophilaceae bacterium]